MRTIPLEDAVAPIPDRAGIVIGGFMAVGTPERLVEKLVRRGTRDPAIIATDQTLPGPRAGDAGRIRPACRWNMLSPLPRPRSSSRGPCK